MLSLCSLMLLAACHGGRKPSSQPPASSSYVDSTDAEQVADTTIYGTSGEFGMSTFTLITDGHDTLDLTRTANDGTDGKIYGDLNEGERYALTTRDHGEAIGILINLTQLDRHLKGYEIRNGHLFVDGKQVEIDELDARKLKLKQ